MNRKELISSDEYVTETIDCIVVSGKGVKQTRSELYKCLLDLQKELIEVYSKQECTCKYYGHCPVHSIGTATEYKKEGITGEDTQVIQNLIEQLGRFFMVLPSAHKDINTSLPYYADAKEAFEVFRAYRPKIKKEEGEDIRKEAIFKKALDGILNMKRLPNETDDKYAFNRCWNLAHDAFNEIAKLSTATQKEGIDKEEEIIKFAEWAIDGYYPTYLTGGIIDRWHDNNHDNVEDKTYSTKDLYKIFRQKDSIVTGVGFKCDDVETRCAKQCDWCKANYPHSETSSIPVVDYEKEAKEHYPYVTGFGEKWDNIKNEEVDKLRIVHIRARQMSSPSDTNCKVKGLRKLLSDTWDTAMAKGFGVPWQQNKTDYLNSIQDTPDTI